jgi:hypothetical protein
MVLQSVAQKRKVVLITAIFLTTRIFLACWYETPGTDLDRYGLYALKYRAALRNSSTIYNYHKETIEYPPLAIAWMSLPIFFVGGNETLDGFTREAYFSWKSLFKKFYFIFDVSVFVVLLLLVIKRLKFLESDSLGLAIYLISGLFLLNFLYDRLDLFLGGIIFFAYILMLSRLHWTFALSTLAVGINFKLIPILLVPIFLIGSLPAQYCKRPYKDLLRKDFLRDILLRTIFIVTVTVLIFLPFYLWGGRATLDFLSYHGDRGLEIGSTYSNMLMLLNYFGLPAYVTHGYGGYNLESPWAPFFATISSGLIAVSTLWILIILIKSLKRFSLQYPIKGSAKDKQLNLARNMPETFLCITIATLLISMATSKVLSPQYLFWVVPLFGLLPFQNKEFKISGLLFLGACLLTTLIFPYLFYSDFVHDIVRFPDGSVSWAAPTVLATVILFARNILLIATISMLVYAVKAKDANKGQA